MPGPEVSLFGTPELSHLGRYVPGTQVVDGPLLTLTAHEEAGLQGRVLAGISDAQQGEEPNAGNGRH